MSNPMQYVPVKPSIPRPTQLYNLLYNGNIVRRGIPKGMAYAIKAQLIGTGQYQGTKFEVKEHIN